MDNWLVDYFSPVKKMPECLWGEYTKQKVKEILIETYKSVIKTDVNNSAEYYADKMCSYIEKCRGDKTYNSYCNAQNSVKVMEKAKNVINFPVK